MKKKLILVTVGVLVVLWAFASLVYDKIKIS